MERLAGLWRAVVACAVALVLGACVGVLVEHQRAKDTSNSPALATAPRDPASTNWFHGHVPESCPALKAWYAAFGKAVYVLPAKATWAAKRPALLQAATALETSTRSLIPLATSTGQRELRAMLSRLDAATTAIRQSPSQAAFQNSSAGGKSAPQIAAAVSFMVRGAQSCARSTTSTTKAKTPATT